MEIRVERGKGRTKGRHCKASIDGAMTIYNAAAGKTALLDALAGSAELEIDLSAVTEMDTAGLQVLVMIKREAVGRGKRVRLAAHSATSLEVLDLYNLVAYFGDPVVISSRAKARRAKD